MIIKNIVFVVAFFLCGWLNAQSDTSIFFRYAATFDQLIPGQFGPVAGVVPDTSDMKMYNIDLKNMSLEKSGSVMTQSDRFINVTYLDKSFYKWDAQGRLIYYHTTDDRDTNRLQDVQLNYLTGQKANGVVYTSGARTDSLLYAYNRMGTIGSLTYRSHRPDSNVAYTMKFLYDQMGRLIVATNMYYGPLVGTYTYEYNKDGRLIRRTFDAGGTGVILCTDTIEYSYQLASQSIMIATHRLKVAGMEKWTLLEAKTYYPFSGTIISYSDYNDADSNFLYQNYPEYTVRYEYDDQGRLSGEFFGTTLQPDLFETRYYYGTYSQPDSVVYSETVFEKKSQYKRVYSRDARYYNQKGRLKSRVITNYEFGTGKRSRTVAGKEVYTLEYHWD